MKVAAKNDVYVAEALRRLRRDPAFMELRKHWQERVLPSMLKEIAAPSSAAKEGWLSGRLSVVLELLEATDGD